MYVPIQFLLYYIQQAILLLAEIGKNIEKKIINSPYCSIMIK